MLFVVTALNCEAEPLIDSFELLKKERVGDFLIYRNEEISLIISGIGKVNAATAVGVLFGLLPSTPSCHAWINVGIAGHKHYDLGQGFLAHKVVDFSSGQKFYPCFIQGLPCKTSSLITVEKPEKKYPENDFLYDMEASGFYAACMRFSTVEMVHCFKVISDNCANPIEKIEKRHVSNFIGDKVPEIKLIVSDLQKLSIKLESIGRLQEEELTPFFFRWHFTATQKYELKRLLQRWRAVEPGKSIWDPALEKQTQSSKVLGYLEEKINRIPLHFS